MDHYRKSTREFNIFMQVAVDMKEIYRIFTCKLHLKLKFIGITI